MTNNTFTKSYNSSLSRILVIIFWTIIPILCNYAVTIARTDKTPSVGLCGYSTPVDTTTAWFTFWDEHVEFQQTGKSWYYPHATRNQAIGSYTEIIADYPPYMSGATAGLYASLVAYFDNLGVHHDSAFAHFQNNTYYYPAWDVENSHRLSPGWNPSQNDLNHNWVRDWEADWDWNNGAGTTNFTVQRTTSPYYIQDAGGGQSGVSWSANKWKRDYVRLGWNGDGDTVSYRADSSTSSRIYLPTQPPSHTYLWFIVDDSAANDHNAVAMADSQAHMEFFNWGLEYFNFGDSRVRSWAGKWCHKIVNDIASVYQAPGWLYIDDVQKDMQVKNVMVGGKNLEGWNNSTTFRTDIKNLYRTIRDSLGWGHGIIGNIANYQMEEYDTLAQYFNGVFHEYLVDMTQSTGDINSVIDFIKRQRNVWNLRVHNLHVSNLQVGGSYDRNKVAALAFYYIIKDDSTYMLYDCTGQYGILYGDTTNWYFGLMGVDIGTPTDAATYVSSPNYWIRNFTKGKVILKLRDNSQNYTSTTNIPLSGYYYQLDVNGNIVGDSINQISIRNADGAILLNTVGGSQSQIYPPEPLSPQNGATVDTAQPTLIIRNTQDSLGRPLLYYFELDSNYQFNTQAKKESTPFELEIGQDSTTRWTVPTPLSSGIYYWRSRAYTNTYPSDTSQTSTVYHFQLSTAVGDSLYSIYLNSPVGDEQINTLRPSLNAQFIHNSFDRDKIRVKFEISDNPSFNSGRTILSPYVNIPEDLVIFWTIDRDLNVGRKYFWRVNVYDSDILVEASDLGSFFTGSIHVFPNPFKPSQGNSFITFRNIPLNSKIIITTISGELVRELSDNTTTDVVWDVKNQKGQSLASGAYYYRVDLPSGSVSGKLVIIK